jgi:hypothetical protein
LKSFDNAPRLRVRTEKDLSLSAESLLGLMTDVLAKGRAFRFKALGYSMSPFIRDGDLITVAPLRGRGLRRGDVVAYVRPANGRLAVHRIVGRRESGLIVKGDHETTLDFPIPETGILGVVERVERNGRRRRLGLGPERRAIAFLSRKGAISWAFKTFGRNANNSGKS